MFIPYAIKEEGQLYRFVSSGFIHANWMHLGINMFVLYSFGQLIEQVFGIYFGTMGNVAYIGLYILGIIAAGIPSYLKHQNHSHYRALGASGAVAAVLYSFILILPVETLQLYFAIPVPAIIFGVLYIGYEYYASKKMTSDGIGHDAHLYGAIFGFLFTMALRPSLITRFIEQITTWNTLPLMS